MIVFGGEMYAIFFAFPLISHLKDLGFFPSSLKLEEKE